MDVTVGIIADIFNFMSNDIGLALSAKTRLVQPSRNPDFCQLAGLTGPCDSWGIDREDMPGPGPSAHALEHPTTRENPTVRKNPRTRGNPTTREHPTTS